MSNTKSSESVASLVEQNGLIGNYLIRRNGQPWKTGLTAQGACTMASDRELDRLSIRTGCETELNRCADMELKRRGFRFDTTEQRWVKR